MTELIECDDFFKCPFHGESLDFFCPKHDEVLCKTCNNDKHEGCPNVTNIEEASIQQYENDSSGVKEVISDLAENIDKLIKDQKENQTCLEEQKSNILKEIRNFRNKIDDHLDNLQQDLMDELSGAYNKISEEIKELVEALEIKKSEVDILKDRFLETSENENSAKHFILIKRAKKEYSSIAKPVNKLLHGIAHSSLEYDVCPEAELLILEIESLGSIAIAEKSSALILSGHSDDLKLNLSQTRNIADLKLKLNTEFHIKNKPELSVQNCVILPNDQFLFVDEKNERLVVHDKDGTHHHDISVSNKPFDVTIVDNRRIGVTYGRARQIEILDISKHKCDRIIKTTNDCWGIVHQEGNLFVVVYRKGIEVFSTAGQTLTVVPINNDHVFYIAVHEDKIYYTDWAENTVNCCDFNGDEVWCYGYDNVVSQQGIATDTDGNVFVVGYRTNNVMVTSTDGRRFKILLTGESDGLNWPTGLFYDVQGDRLLICNETNSHAALYNIE